MKKRVNELRQCKKYEVSEANFKADHGRDMKSS
jgi:hypothetical protein